MGNKFGVSLMSICDICVTDRSLCDNCRDNPKYKDVPTKSLYQNYIPTCPRGYDDCVNDPAYIKCYHSEWYKELYGDKTPEEASENCILRVQRDPDQKYYCYDDEDK